MKNSSNTFILLLVLGLLVMAAAQVLISYMHWDDSSGGMVMGVGIGFFFAAFIMRRKKVKPS